MEWVARGIGVFYLLGGLVALRQVRMNAYLDRALAQITLKRTPVVEHIFNGSGAAIGVLTAVSGVGLILLHRWTVWAFIACWAAQALYLLWATRWYPPEEPAGELGRRRTTNAFVGWTVMTGAVTWWTASGLLSA
jgi:hypothetical protein